MHLQVRIRRWSQEFLYRKEKNPTIFEAGFSATLLGNNRPERSIKPFVIGRKNWLFSVTPKSVLSSATIYSVDETAKENGLDSFVYLTFLFERLTNVNTRDLSKLDELLPWDVTAESNFRPPAKLISE